MSTVEKKITEFPVFSIKPQANDIFLAVRDTSGIPTTGTFTYGGLFSNVSVPATFSNTVVAKEVTTGSLTITSIFTPQSSNSVIALGAIRFDENYIYVGIGSKIKRVKLEDF